MGLRYHGANVETGEKLKLAREPRNPFNKRAIRVDNARGQQVGHLKQALASVLVTLLDRGWIQINAVAPFGRVDRYTMDTYVVVWGPKSVENQVRSFLRQRYYGLVKYTCEDAFDLARYRISHEKSWHASLLPEFQKR